MSMPVATGSLRIVKGSPKTWKRQTASGNAHVTSWFCADCGGRIYGARDTRPDTINVRPGTLDDTTWLAPAAHLFMSNAQPWEHIDEASICFDELPNDFKETTARWRAQWKT